MDQPLTREQFKRWGREGGRKRMNALTKAQRKAFSRKGVNARRRQVRKP